MMGAHKKAILWLAICLLVGGGAIALTIWNSTGREPLDLKPGTDKVASRKSDTGAANANDILGHSKRPDDKQQASKSPSDKKDEKDKKKSPFDYGKLPTVKGDANPNVKSVVEALRDKKNPERLSPLIAPKPFDAKSFKENPQAYLDVVEPGRAFQTAQPGKGVPRLTPLSSGFKQILQGETTTLKVAATPGAPVSFTSFDTGQFDNQLTAITVQADKNGVAQVNFLATTGTIEDVRILAGSPMTSGQARFVVNVQLPSSDVAPQPQTSGDKK